MLRLHIKTCTQKIDDIFHCTAAGKIKYHLQPCLICGLSEYWSCLQPFARGGANSILVNVMEYNKLFQNVTAVPQIEIVTFVTEQCGSSNFILWNYLKRHNLKIPVQQIQSYNNDLIHFSPRSIIDCNLHAFLCFLSTELFQPYFTTEIYYHPA